MKRSTFFCSLAAVLAICGTVLGGQQQGPSDEPAGPEVNPYLILVHDQAVHRELKLTEEQKRRITRVTDTLDGPFLQLQNQPLKEATPKLERLVDQAKAQLRDVLKPEQRRRLTEIWLQVQGARALLRKEVADKLKLDQHQRREIGSIVADTRREIVQVQREGKTDTSSQTPQQQITRLRSAERKQIVATLNQAQKRQLRAMLGRRFDQSRLGRVALKAPELVSADNWINTSPLSLEQLRGNVVALHFWAFG